MLTKTNNKTSDNKIRKFFVTIYKPLEYTGWTALAGNLQCSEITQNIDFTGITVTFYEGEKVNEKTICDKVSEVLGSKAKKYRLLCWSECFG